MKDWQQRNYQVKEGRQSYLTGTAAKVPELLSE